MNSKNIKGKNCFWCGKTFFDGEYFVDLDNRDQQIYEHAICYLCMYNRCVICGKIPDPIDNTEMNAGPKCWIREPLFRVFQYYESNNTGTGSIQCLICPDHKFHRDSYMRFESDAMSVHFQGLSNKARRSKEETKQIITNIMQSIAENKELIKQIFEPIKEIVIETMYSPDGIGAQKAKERFEAAANKGGLDED